METVNNPNPRFSVMIQAASNPKFCALIQTANHSKLSAPIQAVCNEYRQLFNDNSIL